MSAVAQSATSVPQLAKLTRPRLHRVLARERLFARLDACRTSPDLIGKPTRLCPRRALATWTRFQPLPRVITRGRDNDQMLAKGPPLAVLSAKHRIMAGCRTAPDASLEMQAAVYRLGIELRVQWYDAMLPVFSTSNRPASIANLTSVSGAKPADSPPPPPGFRIRHRTLTTHRTRQPRRSLCRHGQRAARRLPWWRSSARPACSM